MAPRKGPAPPGPSPHRPSHRAPPPRGGRTLRIAGLASHNGTNLRHIDAACRAGPLDAELALLIANNGGASILTYAQERSIPWQHLSGTTHPDADALDQAILEALVGHDIDVVFLSGYMKRLGPKTVDRFRGRILNVHPALLPRHGGQGMYGDRVYEAVLAAGDTEAGATVHVVDEEYDHGPVVLQHVVPVEPGDDVERLRARVRDAERLLCVEVVARLANGSLDLRALPGAGPMVRAGSPP